MKKRIQKKAKGKALEVGWLFNDEHKNVLSLSWSIRCINISSTREVHWTTSHKSTFLCYVSPKGTLIIQNLNSVLNEEGQWKSPREFNPDNFLNDQGEFVKPEAFMPFSTGMRAGKENKAAFVSLYIRTCSGMQTECVKPNCCGWLWGFSPFSGPRMCLGEGLARMELFLIMVTLLRKFKFTWPEEAGEPDYTPVYGVTLTPKPYRMKIEARATE